MLQYSCTLQSRYIRENVTTGSAAAGGKELLPRPNIAKINERPSVFILPVGVEELPLSELVVYLECPYRLVSLQVALGMGLSYSPVGLAAVCCLQRFTADLSLSKDGERTILLP